MPGLAASSRTPLYLRPHPTTPPLTVAPHLIPYIHAIAYRVRVPTGRCPISSLPSHLTPSSEHASHVQAMRSSADDHVGQSNADEQNDAGSSAFGKSNSDEESTAHEWIVERVTGKRTFRRWRDIRVQGTLPLALSARIPLEVFEFIVDEMDRPTLVAAALVCAAWYPRAMHNLYHPLEIRSRRSFNMLFKQIRASPRVEGWLASTCQLVVNECQDLKDDHFPSIDVYDNGLRFLQALPLALTGLMPRLRILRISHARLCFIPTYFFLALSRFESVKSLTLFECRLNSITQLRRIVSAFPRLTDLTMSVHFTQHAASYAGASLFWLPSHIRLRYLNVHVHDESMVTFLDWMMHSGLCTSLAELTFISTNFSSTARAPINNLLEAVGGSLTRFCEIYLRVNYTVVPTNMSRNTALRSWKSWLNRIGHEAEHPWLKHRTAWARATDELRDLFSTIRSHQLEHIEFTVDVQFQYFDQEGPVLFSRSSTCGTCTRS
ncbi:uncharacterized protein B0H18DRAFT_364047 [Fomitopsis serialis]|uniref:uncharacterized protein n=1 Tax=Fomitopsis serialis TaxID=139415 RepID=UPI00200848B8|nr:uncharacterized protein B0H18DRAFT_364047 [Neoantrodia serialis]KAH9911390.1 hypothetical protein B0H18DRAFT_364047 [Neoantrodia serialis]